MTDTITAPAWSLTWHGSTWTDQDLTGHHAAAVAEMLGIVPPWNWFDLTELHPVDGPLQVMALIAAFTVINDDVRGAAARTAVLETIKDATVDDLLAAINL